MLRIAAVALGLFCTLASADEAAIRRVMESKLGGAKIEGIQPAPIAGLYEVRYRAAEGIGVFYTDANANYIVSGKIYDARSSRNLTDETLRKLNAVKFDALPFSQAVKIQRGNGKRVVAMFSDPYCPYCQRFEKTLQEIDDITIYVFMYPVIRPELAAQSKAVWCSPDRSKAWLDLALHQRPPAVSATCETPVEKNLALGKSLGVTATPTMILPTGEKVSGGMQAADFREVLDDAMAQAKPR
ncbi:MAG TPA: DsbC family protein [Burkholderiales bacterium]|nr:DsbC family protein [Burkholderiales bacterium]